MLKPMPSPAQAKLIARLWATDSVAHHYSDNKPTVATCIKKLWLEPNGKHGQFLSGTKYSEYVVSRLGLLALEHFLTEQRWKQILTEQRWKQNQPSAPRAAAAE